MVINRERGQALVFFDQINCAQAAVKEMRGVVFRGRRLQVDFASRECQETFFEHIERQANNSEKSWDSRPSPAPSFDVTYVEFFLYIYIFFYNYKQLSYTIEYKFL